MYQLNNLFDNKNMKVIANKGNFQVFEHERDLSVSPSDAVTAYFSSEMNVRKRQVLVNMNGNSVTVQAGAMQWMVGNVQASSGVKGVGNFLGKMVSSAVTGESAVKPVYSGEGALMLEPTYKHIILLDLDEWNGSVVLDDGLFLACDGSINQKVVARSNISSAVLGKEGLFNLSLNGSGIAVLESYVPQQELIVFEMKDDCIKIVDYTESGRVKNIRIGNIELSGVDVRKIFGLKSTNFEVQRLDDKIIFSVFGYGHGVGLSQTGSDALAKNGIDANGIIKHFYKNC